MIDGVAEPRSKKKDEFFIFSRLKIFNLTKGLLDWIVSAVKISAVPKKRETPVAAFM